MPRERYDTLQQVFDDAYLGLAAQGFEQSLAEPADPDHGGECAYRGLGGLRCAIGHCIPDGLYDPRIEGSTPGTDGEAYPVARQVFDSVFGSINKMDLRHLQSAHDEGIAPITMRRLLEDFARETGLTVPAVPN